MNGHRIRRWRGAWRIDEPDGLPLPVRCETFAVAVEVLAQHLAWCESWGLAG